MRISDWSSDGVLFRSPSGQIQSRPEPLPGRVPGRGVSGGCNDQRQVRRLAPSFFAWLHPSRSSKILAEGRDHCFYREEQGAAFFRVLRSEEHTSELQSLMRISYAVFCLKKKQKHTAPLLIIHPNV